MNCLLARQTLDAARPDRSDWDAPELRAAVSHLAGCTLCSDAVGAGECWDTRLAEAFSQVEIPEGLAERLAAAVQSAQRTVPVVRPQEVVAPVKRRRWLAWTSAAAVLVGLLGWRLWQPQTSALALDEIQVRVGAYLASSPGGAESAAQVPFDGSFNAAPADPEWRELLARSTPQGLDLDAAPGHDAAAYRFDAGRLSGWLVVLPKQRVASPPMANTPEHSNFRYGPRPQVAWTAGEQVCVCVLDEQQSLNDLVRMLYGTTA